MTHEAPSRKTFRGLVCPHCGYDLTGLPRPVCPECGEPFDPDYLDSVNTLEEQNWRRARRWRVAVVSAVLILTGGLVYSLLVYDSRALPIFLLISAPFLLAGGVLAWLISRV